MISLYKSFILIFCLIQSYQATSQQASIKDLLSAPFPTGLVSDTSQDQMAWVFNKEGIRNIWYAKGPEYLPKQITQFNYDYGRNLSQLNFSADGTTLYFRKGDAANRNGEFPNPTTHPKFKTEDMTLHRVDLTSFQVEKIANGSKAIPSPGTLSTLIMSKGKLYLQKNEEELKDPEILLEVRGTITEASWIPNDSGLKIAFISNRGDHAFAGVFDLQTKKVSWLSPSVDNDGSIVSSPDGTKLAFLRIPTERDRILFVPNRSAQPWSIVVTDLDKMESKIVWTAEKGYGSAFRNISATTQLFWTCSDQIVFPYEKDGYTHLHAIKSDGTERTNLTPGNHEVQFVNMTHDACQILYSSNEGDTDRQHIWSYDFTSGMKQQLSSGTGVQWSPLKTKSGQIFSLASTATIPAHVARIGNKKAINVFPESIPSVFQKGLPEPEQVIFEAPDGMKIHGQLFLPKNISAGEKLPAVMFFHGGSRRQMLLGYHHRGYYHNSFAMNQYLASQGYIVLSVNYRSGIGYGLEFREALEYGANGASEYRDVLGGATYLSSRPDVDKNKIGLWGGSYGGYLTALGLAQNSELFAAGVDIHGVHDWNHVIKNFVPSFNPEKRKEVAKKAYESSPMHFMDGWRSPVLLIHGDDDRNVPFSETVDLVEQLRKRDVYFEQLIFPDEVHGFLLHKNWVNAFERSFDFFERFLKNKSATK